MMSTLQKRVEALERRLGLEEGQQPIRLIITTCIDDQLTDDEVDAAVNEYRQAHPDESPGPFGITFLDVRRGQDGVVRVMNDLNSLRKNAGVQQ